MLLKLIDIVQYDRFKEGISKLINEILCLFFIISPIDFQDWLVQFSII